MKIQIANIKMETQIVGFSYSDMEATNGMEIHLGKTSYKQIKRMSQINLEEIMTNKMLTRFLFVIIII